MIDYGSYPHIIHTIADYAPPETLVSLRKVSRELRKRATTALGRGHVLYRMSPNNWNLEVYASALHAPPALLFSYPFPGNSSDMVALRKLREQVHEAWAPVLSQVTVLDRVRSPNSPKDLILKRLHICRETTDMVSTSSCMVYPVHGDTVYRKSTQVINVLAPQYNQNNHNVDVAILHYNDGAWEAIRKQVCQAICRNILERVYIIVGGDKDYIVDNVMRSLQGEAAGREFLIRTLRNKWYRKTDDDIRAVMATQLTFYTHEEYADKIGAYNYAVQTTTIYAGQPRVAAAVDHIDVNAEAEAEAARNAKLRAAAAKAVRENPETREADARAESIRKVEGLVRALAHCEREALQDENQAKMLSDSSLRDRLLTKAADARTRLRQYEAELPRARAAHAALLRSQAEAKEKRSAAARAAAQQPTASSLTPAVNQDSGRHPVETASPQADEETRNAALRAAAAARQSQTPESLARKASDMGSFAYTADYRGKQNPGDAALQEAARPKRAAATAAREEANASAAAGTAVARPVQSAPPAPGDAALQEAARPKRAAATAAREEANASAAVGTAVARPVQSAPPAQRPAPGTGASSPERVIKSLPRPGVRPAPVAAPAPPAPGPADPVPPPPDQFGPRTSGWQRAPAPAPRGQVSPATPVQPAPRVSPVTVVPPPRQVQPAAPVQPAPRVSPVAVMPPPRQVQPAAAVPAAPTGRPSGQTLQVTGQGADSVRMSELMDRVNRLNF